MGFPFALKHAGSALHTAHRAAAPVGPVNLRRAHRVRAAARALLPCTVARRGKS